jgi:hypothetical protein
VKTLLTARGELVHGDVGNVIDAQQHGSCGGVSMRYVYLGAVALAMIIVLSGRASRGQTADPAGIRSRDPGPTTNSVASPPGAAASDPFAPHLPKLDHQQRPARGQPVVDWEQVNAAYSHAAAERATGAAARAAGNQLNAGDLANEGVVR